MLSSFTLPPLLHLVATFSQRFYVCCAINAIAVLLHLLYVLIDLAQAFRFPFFKVNGLAK